MNNTPVLQQYVNGDFEVTVYADGTKVRKGSGRAIFPESIDCKITNKCNANCAWCHEASHPCGKHADLNKLHDLLMTMPTGIELALGGGNVFEHLDFIPFVEQLSQKHICNITVNERHFPIYWKEIKHLTDNHYVRGVGYSYTTNACTWDYEHLVTHVIIGITHPRDIAKIVSPSKKILLLGYKEFGKGVLYKLKNKHKVNENIQAWYRYLPLLIREYQISMDNLAIEQLNVRRIFLQEEDFYKFYMGDEGRFSIYIDAVEETFTINSTCGDRFGWDDRSIEQMFKFNQIQLSMKSQFLESLIPDLVDTPDIT